jgi:hypothetical protein
VSNICDHYIIMPKLRLDMYQLTLLWNNDSCSCCH